MIVWRRDLPRLLVTTGAAGVVAGAASPWVASGAVDRSSYEIAGLVERLGFASDGLFALAVRAWAVVPLLVVAAAVCIWSGRPIAGAVFATVGGGYALAVCAGVSRAPDAGVVRVLAGPTVTAIGAGVLLIGAAAGLVVTRTTRPVAPAPPSASPVGPS